jgi:guanylate kinase
MRLNTKLKIGLDADDVLFECIAPVIITVNRELGTDFKFHDCKSWNFDYFPEQVREAIYSILNTNELYESQRLYDGAVKMVDALLDRGHDVIFASAIGPEFMSIRARRLMEAFPRVPKQNIMLGARKDLLSLDVLLDDAMHNIEASMARYPVLFRKPWNRPSGKMPLSVSSYDEFIALVDRIAATPSLEESLSWRAALAKAML